MELKRFLSFCFKASVGFVIFAIVLSVIGANLIARHDEKHKVVAKIARSIDKQLGFSYGPEPRDQGYDMAYVVAHVDPGSPMAVAGLKKLDGIQCDAISFGKVRSKTCTTLYQRMFCRQGGTAMVPILRDGQSMALTLNVPQFEFEDRKILFERRAVDFGNTWIIR